MAIENSIAGPIIPNYALIDKNNLTYRRALCSNSPKLNGIAGQELVDILEVHSHHGGIYESF
jgi:prephenate dehydratase